MVDSLYPEFGILLVDDERAFIRSLSLALERRGGITHLYQTSDSREVMTLIEQNPDIELVLLDLNMPDISGDVLLKQIVERHPNVGVIIVSGMNQIETAVDCLRLGAYDYFVKTTEENRLLEGIKRAITMQEMRRENEAMRRLFLSDTIEHPEVFESIITQDKKLRSIFQYLESVAGSRQPVMISGESGVGKEHIAEAVHKLSGRKGELVSVNVAGIDDEVFADTLFGHSRGAFTGADRKRAGMVEAAADGTLFLDEIGDLSHTSQTKLLRLLQEGDYYPLGSDKPKRSRARVVVATHHDVKKLVEVGSFRKDLYFRLCIHQIEVPPLRERKGDIPLLFKHFLELAAVDMNKPVPAFPKELPQLLSTYHFPGNIRELQALVYDAVSQHKSHTLSMEVFRRVIDNCYLDASTVKENSTLFDPNKPLPTLQEINEILITEAMIRSQGNQSLASRMLGISQPALSKRLKNSKSSRY
ncbi:sigma-54-dependent Fis family transcriptional regulator [Vibrio natriegens]|uniref:sigma-54-dependent transcriptional regulator n=1 Tax=Vibrio natriegens TaxID=691 RepID=UPI0015943F89|nr:sigma-54 dependent transcriptional regulator [Vibrio natriegens]NVC95158.1 sigma-54-dependent Fis family transcriptional regulator [Vibrio natriegens]